eukprot:366256-Chlamydomonas_euryale.AAC.16
MTPACKICHALAGQQRMLSWVDVTLNNGAAATAPALRSHTVMHWGMRLKLRMHLQLSAVTACPVPQQPASCLNSSTNNALFHHTDTHRKLVACFRVDVLRKCCAEHR